MEPYLVEVTATWGLSVRTGPGTQYQRVGVLPYLTRVEVVEEAHDDQGRAWGKTSQGWIALWYTRRVGGGFGDEWDVEHVVMDLSSWNKLRPGFWNSKVDLLILKATQGCWVDRVFGERLMRARSRGWKVWMYHFWDGSCNWHDTVRHALRVAWPNTRRGEYLVLDVERGPASGVKEFLEYAEHVLGVKPIIYTSAGAWRKVFGDALQEWAAHYPLWVAHYDVERPMLPAEWDTAVLWQYTSRGSHPGVRGHVDLNAVNKVEWEKTFGKTFEDWLNM